MRDETDWERRCREAMAPNRLHPMTAKVAAREIARKNLDAFIDFYAPLKPQTLTDADRAFLKSIGVQP